ncbi:MAG TPA: hypothetical protein VG733_19845 [Chthoniobacteraceae bacterium]|nr:hypothetical protein [Chthoniobacteraceae bacterium]
MKNVAKIIVISLHPAALIATTASGLALTARHLSDGGTPPGTRGMTASATPAPTPTPAPMPFDPNAIRAMAGARM